MIALHYGKDYSLEYLRELCYLNREGVSLTSMSEAAEKLGDKLKNCRPEFFGVRPEVLMILWVPAAKEASP